MSAPLPVPGASTDSWGDLLNTAIKEMQDLSNTGRLSSDSLAANFAPTREYSGVLPQNLPKWRAALAKLRGGLADAKILCVGDSTTAGIGVGGSTNQGSPLAYPSQLAAIFNGAGIPAQRGLAIPGHPGNLDPRWTAGAGWAADVYGAGAYSAWTFNGITTTLTFADAGVSADTFDVYFMGVQGTPGDVSVQATGGAVVHYYTSHTQNVIDKITVTAGSVATTNVLTFTPNSGAGWILGVEPRLSTGNRLRVGNAGCGGSTSAQWVNTQYWGGTDLIRAYAPDLTLLSLGLNETPGDDVSGYLAHMTSIIQAAQASGDVIVWTPVPNAASMSGATTAQSKGVTDFTAACKTLGVPYFDLSTRWGNGDAANGLGLMWNYEHPNEAGYADIAQMLAGPLRNL